MVGLGSQLDGWTDGLPGREEPAEGSVCSVCSVSRVHGQSRSCCKMTTLGLYRAVPQAQPSVGIPTFSTPYLSPARPLRRHMCGSSKSSFHSLARRPSSRLVEAARRGQTVWDASDKTGPQHAMSDQINQISKTEARLGCASKIPEYLDNHHH